MNKKTLICILIVCILALTCAGAIAFIHFNRSDSQIAEIYHHGELIETIDLKNVTESYEFTIDSGSGAYNTIRVEPGKIAVIDASCPDKICVHTGYISDSLMPITCLPNELVIRIQSSDGSTSGLDAISQ